MNPTTFAIRDEKQPRAIILVHGFGGESHSTFGMMPAFLAGNPALYSWDVHCFGYPTALRPDITGVWAADPDLTTLGNFLTANLRDTAFRRYAQVALIGHSMGGLVIQRSLADVAYDGRVSHVILFGTPSDGLKKAGLGRLFKRQARDMMRGGPFITQLRSDWKARFPDRPPFTFRVAAGLRDDFVPRESSVDIFAAEYRTFVNGNHLEMVKPQVAATDSMELLLHLLAAAPVPAFVKNRQDRVDELWPARMTLSEPDLRDLVFALEAAGREPEAVELLETRPGRSVDLTGILAGRLKRRWLADPEIHAADGQRAQDLYHEAYTRAAAALDHAGAFYNGINDAFMALALGNDRDRAAEIAARVLTHTRASKVDKWLPATQGEAYLYRGDPAAALLAYSEAVKGEWTPRQIDSMRQQALWAARLIGDASVEAELEVIFDSRQA